jgi:hypothetical protein
LKFQELFPRWRNASIARDLPWTETYDLADDNAFCNILGLMVHEQSVCSAHGHGIFYNVCKAMLCDVLALQLAPPYDCKPINLEYLQFEVSLSPVRMAINAGDFGLTHDWILNGFSDEHSHAVQRVFFIDRFEKFLSSKVPWIEKNRTSSMIDWFCAFYYYCWCRAALFEAAMSLFPVAMDVIRRSPPEEEQTVDTLRMMLNWAAGYNHPSARHLAMLLEQIFKTPGVSE